jgi:hypothetical protein
LVMPFRLKNATTNFWHTMMDFLFIGCSSFWRYLWMIWISIVSHGRPICATSKLYYNVWGMWTWSYILRSVYKNIKFMGHNW